MSVGKSTHRVPDFPQVNRRFMSAAQVQPLAGLSAPESPNTPSRGPGIWPALSRGDASARPAMQLPFTRDQFFDLFAAYNEALWPALIALWIASVVASVLLLSSRRPPDRWISALLSAHWAWSALAYHVAFFTSINPAAWVFAALFLVQAALFFWSGVVQGRLSFAPQAQRVGAGGLGPRRVLAGVSGINAVQHLTWSRIPSFGVRARRRSSRPGC